MKLKFARFDTLIDFEDCAVTTIEVNNRTLFCRIVQSLESELGEQAVEPYYLFVDERSVASKGKLLFLNELPSLPLHDRSFEKALYAKLLEQMTNEADMDGRLSEINRVGGEIRGLIQSGGLSMWGRYNFEVNWDAATFLKAFGFGVEVDECDTLLDRWIKFLGLCVDIGLNKPLVTVNLKSFLDTKDLQELYRQAFFHGIQLVLIESWRDERQFLSERKIRIDQHLLDG